MTSWRRARKGKSLWASERPFQRAGFVADVSSATVTRAVENCCRRKVIAGNDGIADRYRKSSETNAAFRSRKRQGNELNLKVT